MDDHTWVTNMSALIEKHITRFVEQYCVLEKTGFIPVTMLADALRDYYKDNGLYDDVAKYYKRFSKPHIEDMYKYKIKHDTRSGMFLGIRLVSWPNV